MLFLVEPTHQYKDSFLEGLREFHQERLLLQYDIATIEHNFERFMRQAQNEKDRTKLPPDVVPSSRFWLVEGDEQQGTYIGNVSVRYELNAFLFKIGGHIGYQIRPSKRCSGYGKQGLRLGLQKAHELGITRVLVTCDETNLASKKVIEYNGGQFENAVEVQGSAVRKLRYWFDTASLTE